MSMFSWLTGDIAAVESRFSALESDAVKLQALVTSLSDGLLTAQTELNFIKGALASQGIVLPTVVLPTVVPAVPVAPATVSAKPKVVVSQEV